jgi:lantibiotic modifying enzyme
MEDGLFDPSFFTGAAGVGYALLRLSCAGKLSSILLLE